MAVIPEVLNRESILFQEVAHTWIPAFANSRCIKHGNDDFLLVHQADNDLDSCLSMPCL